MDISDLIRKRKLQLFKTAWSDTEKDGYCKMIWLENNQYKKYFWSQWLKAEEIKNIGKVEYCPETDEISNHMILNRREKVVDKRICLNPFAFCWDSGRSVFLKPVTVVHTIIYGPGEPLREKFYFETKRFSLWLIKNS